MINDLALRRKAMAFAKSKTAAIIFSILFLVVFSNTIFSATYYVSKSGNDANDGTSWNSAFLNIKTALAKTASGDSVWVSAGTYTEMQTLIIQTGISLYGGFAGNESDFSQRNSDIYRTIIDGNRNYQCVRTRGTIDGFEVTKGYAVTGGGIYNEAAKVENCKVYFNGAYDSGGGIYSFYGANINCKIYSNNAGLGGGIASDFGHVINCKIYSNTGGNGGGYHNNQGKGWDLEVYSNFAYFNGGGIRSLNGSIDNCVVYNNSTATDYDDSYGGGIDVYSGTITNSRVYSNSSKNGGGIFSNQASISDCVIYSNSSDIQSRSSGGGICNISKSVITNCQLYSNTSYAGGGIRHDSGTINNCTAYLNYASSYGGGIYNYGKLSNCKVYLNRADEYGGGIYNVGDVVNSIIYSNSANSGGGVYCYGTLRNSTIYFNSAYKEGGGLYLGVYSIAANSIIWNNISAGDVFFQDPGVEISYSCFQEANGKNSNIKANPLFANTLGNLSTWDFHLQNGSPCIDNGTSVNAPADDIEGNPRPGGDGKTDMGAYESPDDYQPGVPQPPKNYYVSKTGDDSDGLSWSTAFTTIKKAISAGNDNTYTIYVSKGIYSEGETIIINSRNSLYGGFDGINSSIDGRDLLQNQTIIDGNSSYRCVTNSGILDGFYITNGKIASEGGGIYNESGTVRNCVVYSNTAESSNGLHNGGGIYNNEGQIENCIAHSNSADKGGGIYSKNGPVTNCKIYSNTAAASGGGIYNYRGNIEDTEVYSNCVTTNATQGGGILNVEGNILNSKIYSNSCSGSSSYGGGINNNSGTISNSIIYNNISNGTNAQDRIAGGIYSSGTIINCTIYGNTADESGSGILVHSGRVINSIIWNNKGSVDVYLQQYSLKLEYCCSENTDFKNGSIKANPLFVNTKGNVSTYDFRLQNGSMCIDSGTSVTTINKDIDGNPRPGGDDRIDIGAYESPDAYLPGAPQNNIRLYVSKYGDDTSGTSWNTAYKSIAKAVSNMPEDDFYEIWIAEGVYIEGATIMNPGRCYLKGGFKGNETNIDERNILTNKAIIDGEKKYPCISNYGTLDGLYIANGYSNEAPGGGGVFNSFGDIANCFIYFNSCSDDGGGINNFRGTISNCSVYSNTAAGNYSSAGGIYNYFGKIQNSNISFNYLDGAYWNGDSNGGGIVDDYGGGIITNNVISNNTSQTDGGGIQGGAEKGGGKISNCAIYSNSAKNFGGGVSVGTLENCAVYSNSAQNGGGIHNANLSNCSIYLNYAKTSGGGISNYLGAISNSLIYSNSASRGGGIYIDSGSIMNCTVYSNFGSGIYADSGSDSRTIINSIIWKNKAYDYVGVFPDISYSCFNEANGTNHNIKADPLFINTDDKSKWDFNLKEESPCIDEGTMVSLDTDINGVPRPQGSGWDMGAYEFIVAQIGDVNQNGKIDKPDVDIIRSYMCGQINLTVKLKQLSDFNADGKIDIADIIALLNRINAR